MLSTLEKIGIEEIHIGFFKEKKKTKIMNEILFTCNFYSEKKEDMFLFIPTCKTLEILFKGNVYAKVSMTRERYEKEETDITQSTHVWLCIRRMNHMWSRTTCSN